MNKNFVIAGFIALFSLLLAACGAESESGTVGLSPGSVTFDVNVIEVKGATDGIAAPEIDPHSLSAGYKFKPPGEYDAENPEKWQVSSYMFSPSSFVVVQGDDVTLRTFVINGDEHLSWIEAPDGSRVDGTEVMMNRGRQYAVNFTADQEGYYAWRCADHDPTMSGTILALPASA